MHFLLSIYRRRVGKAKYESHSSQLEKAGTT